MYWIVYLLISKKINQTQYSYVGITTDLERRLKQHNNILKGGAKATIHRPYEVLYSINNIEDRSMASKLEYAIKQYRGWEKRLEYMKKIDNLSIL